MLALEKIDELFAYFAAQIPDGWGVVGTEERPQLDCRFPAVADLEADDLAVP